MRQFRGHARRQKDRTRYNGRVSSRPPESSSTEALRQIQHDSSTSGVDRQSMADTSQVKALLGIRGLAKLEVENLLDEDLAQPEREKSLTPQKPSKGSVPEPILRQH